MVSPKSHALDLWAENGKAYKAQTIEELAKAEQRETILGALHQYSVHTAWPLFLLTLMIQLFSLRSSTGLELSVPLSGGR
ncbi:hypothetical protein BH11ARM1_BH11ARM1_00310 [soil metagenome]